LAGLVLNEHREAPGCLHVARRLREIKNELGFTHEALARHAGMPVDRVKSYFALFAASDFILSFCESQALPLKVAVELARFEKATNEARARRLAQRHLESPLTVQQIIQARKQAEGPERKKPAGKAEPVPDRILARFETVYRKNPVVALGALQ